MYSRVVSYTHTRTHDVPDFFRRAYIHTCPIPVCVCVCVYLSLLSLLSLSLCVVVIWMSVHVLHFRNVRAHLLAAKGFAFYVQKKMEMEDNVESGKMRKMWGKLCSPPRVLKLCGATPEWLALQGEAWGKQFAVDIGKLEEAGYTNGQVVCMRGAAATPLCTPPVFAC